MQENDDVKVSRIIRIFSSIPNGVGIDDFDIHDLDTLPVHVQFRVIQGHVVLYEQDDGDARENFVEKLLKCYYEIHPWYQRIINARLDLSRNNNVKKGNS